MVGPYIPVTESEILKPWPIGGFQLADRPTTSGETKSSAERRASPKAPEAPKEGQGFEEKDDPVPEKESSDDDSYLEISPEVEEPETIVVNDEERAVTAVNNSEETPLDGGGDCNHSHPPTDQGKLGDHMPGPTRPDEPGEEDINNLPRGPRSVTILPNLESMSPYQRTYYQRELDAWGHVYRHRDDGRWLIVYQGECPTDWEWEETQGTIQHLHRQRRDAESLNGNLVDELMRLRARIWELERSNQAPSPTPATSRGLGLVRESLRGFGRGIFGQGVFKPSPRF